MTIAGTLIPAGLTHATVTAELDWETYSEAGFEWDAARNRWAGPPGAPGTKRGLEVVGAANYAQHPTARILLLAYDLKDGRGRRRWHPGEPPPLDLLQHVQAGGLLEAWNVGFERWFWESVAVPQFGWPPVAPEQWRCCMAKARAHALPGRLAEVGRVLDLAIQKDTSGTSLIKKFTIPRNPTKLDPRTRIEMLWTQADVDDTLADLLAQPGLKPADRRALAEAVAEDVADTRRFADYNETDIATEAEASARIPDLSPTELRYWQDDQAINHRGVQIDMDSVHACCSILDTALQRYGDELEALAGCQPSEVKQLQGWLHGHGVHMDGMDEDAVDGMLAQAWLPPPARRALEIRSAVGSASVKKVYAMRNQATRTGRLHDTYVFHGARTGRPTGAGVQSTNLPKAGPHVYRCGFGFDGKPLPTGGCGKYHGAHTMHCPWCQRFTLRGPKDAREWNPEAMVDALVIISHRSLDVLETVFGDALLTIAGCLRGLFVAAPGCDLVSSDFTAIEGVVIAAIANERWRLDVFHTHGKIYETSAAKILGITLEEMLEYRKRTGQHHPGRQNPGKIAELALGFMGWVNAWKQFGGPGTDEEIKANIIAWREASPSLVHLAGGQRGGPGVADRWAENPHGCEGMAILAVQNPGQIFRVARLDGTDSGVKYMVHNDVLYCRTPSGGLITYHRPRLRPADQEWRGQSLSFEGWNTNPKNGPLGWVRMNTYAGKLVENLVQKVARDKQMSAIARLHDHGYPIVMHTYDEVVAEVPLGFGSVEELERLMTTPEPWNEGWPLKAAGGWRASRYRKG